ncbi:MAG: winged helix-turn-helix transcriptional regulator [Thermoplasmatota archaeon]
MPPAPANKRVACAPGKPGTNGAGCSIEELFRLLGKAHMLDVLYVISEAPEKAVRFVDIQDRLGLAPNTLSERLKELQKAGLVTRTAYNEIPPRVDYAATPKAQKLGVVFEALCSWAHENDLKPAEASAQGGAQGAAAILKA